MREQDLPRPVATAATLVAPDGWFLVVAQTTQARIRINPPAGLRRPLDLLMVRL